MSDYLINLGKNKVTQIPLKAFGVSIPVELKRAQQPWSEQELGGKSLYVGGGTLAPVITTIAEQTGAKLSGTPSEENRVNALVFDATGIDSIEGLKPLYQFFHDNIRFIRSCGRLVVIGKEATEQDDLIAQAVAQGTEAFTKSLAKEVGRKGATAQLITISNSLLSNEAQLIARLKPVLAFLLSDRPAFVSGQVFRLSDTVTNVESAPLAQPLAGKVALVTGAARGIGRATAEKLAAEGATVVVLDRPEDEAESQKVADAIGGKVFSLDIGKEDAPEKLVSWLKGQFGGVDIVVHNAGITRDKTIGKMPEHFWDLLISVNLTAVVRVTEALLKDGLREGGRIVCLSSISGIAGNFGQTNYTMAKGGVIGLVKHLAPKVAGKGIAINAIAPGLIETRMTAAMPFFTREGARRLSNLGQGGLPVDIAEMVTFLSTPGANGITGQVIRVCGGSLMGA